MKQITVIFNDGKVVAQKNVVYVLFNGISLIITLDSDEQIRLPVNSIASFDIE